MEKNQKSTLGMATFGMAAADPFEGTQQAAVGRPSGIGAQIKSNTRREISDALFDAQNLVTRIREMTGMLCGHEPRTSDDMEAEADGILQGLSQTAGHTSRMIRAAHGELDRLESHFE